MNMEPTKLYYAAWWRRFLAFWIDGIVLFPFMFLQWRIGRISPRLYAALLIPFSILYSGYWVFCHGRWGKTVGKLATGTRVASLDGGHISWRQAFLRNAVEIVLGIVACFALIPAYLKMPIDGYAELTTLARFELLQSMWPNWYPILTKVQQGWVWSEFIVILLNKKRRALHDFIAGTIVIQKNPTRRQAKAEDPNAMDLSKEMKRLQKL
jgi:uncharacterized RDD family membrane protein YckC